MGTDSTANFDLETVEKPSSTFRLAQTVPTSTVITRMQRRRKDQLVLSDTFFGGSLFRRKKILFPFRKKIRKWGGKHKREVLFPIIASIIFFCSICFQLLGSLLDTWSPLYRTLNNHLWTLYLVSGSILLIGVRL